MKSETGYFNTFQMFSILLYRISIHIFIVSFVSLHKVFSVAFFHLPNFSFYKWICPMRTTAEFTSRCQKGIFLFIFVLLFLFNRREIKKRLCLQRPKKYVFLSQQKRREKNSQLKKELSLNETRGIVCSLARESCTRLYCPLPNTINNLFKCQSFSTLLFFFLYSFSLFKSHLIPMHTEPLMLTRKTCSPVSFH